MISYMPRQKRAATARTIRLVDEILEALDRYAEDQMTSSNAVINKILKDKLIELGYISKE